MKVSFYEAEESIHFTANASSLVEFVVGKCGPPLAAPLPQIVDHLGVPVSASVKSLCDQLTIGFDPVASRHEATLTGEYFETNATAFSCALSIQSQEQDGLRVLSNVEAHVQFRSDCP